MRALLLCTLFVVGCQSIEAESDASFAAYAGERSSYMACMHREAGAVHAIRPSADPYYVAVAARERCHGARLALIEAIRKNHDYEIWQQMIAVYDRKAEDIAISRSL